MTKKEAVEVFVERRFDPIPTEWVQIVSEYLGEYPTLPMWGTMWQVESYWGERLMSKAHLVNEDDCEEMQGAYNVLDKDRNATAVYIYEIDGRFLIGVNGAGWDFYDGVWNMLYDLFGLNWHDEEEAVSPYPLAVSKA